MPVPLYAVAAALRKHDAPRVVPRSKHTTNTIAQHGDCTPRLETDLTTKQVPRDSPTSPASLGSGLA